MAQFFQPVTFLEEHIARWGLRDVGSTGVTLANLPVAVLFQVLAIARSPMRGGAVIGRRVAPVASARGGLVAEFPLAHLLPDAAGEMVIYQNDHPDMRGGDKTFSHERSDLYAICFTFADSQWAMHLVLTDAEKELLLGYLTFVPGEMCPVAAGNVHVSSGRPVWEYAVGIAPTCVLTSSRLDTERFDPLVRRLPSLVEYLARRIQ